MRVQDNDNLPTLTIADATSVSESAGSVDFVVTADTTTDTSLSVEYLIENGTGDDFIDVASPNVTEVLSFTSTAGANATATITVPLEDDSLDEANGEVSVTLKADSTPPVGYLVGTPNKGTAPVTDDDAAPELTIAAAEAEEGESIVFTPMLDVITGSDVVISYSTSIESGNTAMANDFTAKTDQITIRAGQTTPFDSDGNPETISIATTEDTDYEGDETFTLTFSATNAGVAGGTKAIGTILNDDLLTVSLAFADFAFGRNYLTTEGKPFNIRVSTTRNVIDDLEVALTLPDGASEGLSFTLPDGSTSVTIPSGKSEIVSAVNITTTTHRVELHLVQPRVSL